TSLSDRIGGGDRGVRSPDRRDAEPTRAASLLQLRTGVPPARSGQAEGPAAGRGVRRCEGGAAMTDLTSTPLLTHEVGSLDKPGWRVKAYAGKPLDHKDLQEAKAWGERIGVERYQDLIAL